MTDSILVPRDLLERLRTSHCRGSVVNSVAQTELREMLARNPKPVCPKCGDTGEADSGGVQPWGESILIPCDCTRPAPAGVVLPDRRAISAASREQAMCANTWNACLDEVAKLNGAPK